jgi:hypothetical protein
MKYKTLLAQGQWVTGENPYGYPAGEKLPPFTPETKFNTLQKLGLLSSEKPQGEAPKVETPKGKKK